MSIIKEQKLESNEDEKKIKHRRTNDEKFSNLTPQLSCYTSSFSFPASVESDSPNIIGHSINIVATARIKELIERGGKCFEMQCFTARERHASGSGTNRIQYLAGRFAAKEAVLTALGRRGNLGISWLDIEVQRLPTGEPSIVLRAKCKEIAAQLGITKWLLSISHTSSYATASAIALCQ